MVLVVAPGDGQPQPAPQGPFLIGRLVIAVEGDGGGVVVQFVEIDGELADGVGDDAKAEWGCRRRRGDRGSGRRDRR